MNSISAPDLAVMEECKDGLEAGSQAVATAVNWGQPGTPAQEESRSKAALPEEQALPASPHERDDAVFSSTVTGLSSAAYSVQPCTICRHSQGY